MRKSGWKLSIETRRKMSETHKRIGTQPPLNKMFGSKNPRWNPDREAVKHNKRNDGEYKQWVLKVKRRDKSICQLENNNCFGYNIAHHIKGWVTYPELRYKINNGITLCQAHHPRKRAKEKRLEPFFMDLVSASSK